MSVYGNTCLVENAIKNQTVFEATSPKTERIWICGPRTYQSVFPSTLKYHNGAVYYSMWKEGAVCCFIIPISGKICWESNLHVLMLLKLTSRKEVIKYDLVYLRAHLDNKCSIRTNPQKLYSFTLQCCAIKQRWVCALQFVITFRAGNWTISESENWKNIHISYIYSGNGYRQEEGIMRGQSTSSLSICRQIL